MAEELNVKNQLTAAVFEFACKHNYTSVIEKIFKDPELLKSLYANLTRSIAFPDEKERVKPVFIFVVMLQRLLSSVETFSLEISSTCYPWNSEALPKIIQLLEITYEQCEFISIKKYFSLVTQLKFLDLMHLLRSGVESTSLVQKLNLHFPRWQPSQKETYMKQFSIENPKILDKVDESCTQCRRLILKLAADPTYRSQYMAKQFSIDMKKMMIDSTVHLKNVIQNLSSNSGLTLVEKSNQLVTNMSQDLGYQLLLDYIQPETSSENLIKFLDEIDSALSPPTGGFSSCLLPFDTMSECSDTPMDSDCGENESASEESFDEKDITITQSDEEEI